MLQRKIYDKLLQWKNQESSKPILLRGARQVGKSTLIQELGTNYKNFVLLNLEKINHCKFFINYGDDVKLILNAIALEFNIEIEAGNTLLFIDEIQEYPKAITLLRYFYEELPGLDVIAAGSLLEFAISEVSSFPVGRVEQLTLHPLDFEEFLMAIGENKALEIYKSNEIPDYAHDKLLQLFHKYVLIGGMPEIVNEYSKDNIQINSLNTIYSSIWDNYKDDLQKYGKNSNEKRVLGHIINVAPSIRDRITLNGFGGSQYSSREISEAFSKLEKAGIVKLIYPTTEIQAPILPNLKRKPKIQFLDTGLLNYAANIQLELMEIKDLNSMYRGFIINHIVFQEIIASSNKIHNKPNFWVRESTNANAEVDLVIPYKHMLIPLEIKSGAKGSLKSLHEFMERCNHKYSFRLLNNKFNLEYSRTRSGKEFIIINLPYYCIGNIESWIEYILKLHP
jgi:uncharacterized protein